MISHSRLDGLMLHSWSPRPSNMILHDFLLKDKAYVLPLLTHLCELKQQISAAVQSISIDTLQCVWHIICVTQRNYIKH